VVQVDWVGCPCLCPSMSSGSGDPWIPASMQGDGAQSQQQDTEQKQDADPDAEQKTADGAPSVETQRPLTQDYSDSDDDAVIDLGQLRAAAMEMARDAQKQEAEQKTAKEEEDEVTIQLKKNKRAKEAAEYVQMMQAREQRQSKVAAQALETIMQGPEGLNVLSADELSSVAIQYLDLDPDGLTVEALRDGVRQFFSLHRQAATNSAIDPAKLEQARKAMGQCMEATTCLKEVAAHFGSDDLDLHALRLQMDCSMEAIEEQLKTIREFLSSLGSGGLECSSVVLWPMHPPR